MVDGSRDASAGVEGGEPFDLNERIRAWRDRLARSEALGTREVDELEDHLRESVDSLVASGLSPVEAFFVATRRLGRPEEIDREFAKLDRVGVGIRRVQWMLVGYLVVSWLTIVIQAVSISVASVASRVAPFQGWFLSVFVVLTSIGMVAAGWITARLARREPTWFRRFARRVREGVATRRGRVGLCALVPVVVTALHLLRGVATHLASHGVSVDQVGVLFHVLNVWGAIAWTYLWPLAMVAYVLHVGRRERAG